MRGICRGCTACGLALANVPSLPLLRSFFRRDTRSASGSLSTPPRLSRPTGGEPGYRALAITWRPVRPTASAGRVRRAGGARKRCSAERLTLAPVPGTPTARTLLAAERGRVATIDVLILSNWRGSTCATIGVDVSPFVALKTPRHCSTRSGPTRSTSGVGPLRRRLLPNWTTGWAKGWLQKS